MAVIRNTPPPRFRHFGSPVQRSNFKVGLVMKSVLRTLGFWARRFIFTILGGWIITLVVPAIACPFVWWSWNHGIAVAFHADNVSWLTAYSLGLFAAVIAGFFRSSLTVNSGE